MEQQDFILVEGINLYANLLDTDQLSVVRGGSFLYKLAIDHIADSFVPEIRAITTGASRGLFLYSGRSNGLPRLMMRLGNFLNSGKYRHLTFAIAHAEAPNLLEAEKKLTAKIRFKQLACVTTAADSVDPDAELNNSPCGIEGRRKATTQKIERDGKTTFMSQSVADRRREGVKHKFRFYYKELKRHKISNVAESLNTVNFCADLQALAKRGSGSMPLDGKIAVLYLDGNGFGAKQRKVLQHCQQENGNLVERQSELDWRLRTQRADFLNQLLHQLIDTDAAADRRFPDSMLVEEQRVRLETLLWGGDEMMLVVPAWMGMDLIQFFYQVSADWTLLEGDEQRLTHAGGLVFCSAKTPIRNVQQLARNLADAVKELPKGREQNLFDYVVLESIDYPVESELSDFFDTRYGKNLRQAGRRPLPSCADWPAIRLRLASQLRSGALAKRQLYRLAHVISVNSRQQTAEGFAHFLSETSSASGDQLGLSNAKNLADYEALLELASEDPAALSLLKQTLAQLFGVDLNSPLERAMMWLNLTELWDYLIPDLLDETPTSEPKDAA